MALVKVKPTSPGRRAVVQVVNANLHKGKPFAALTESKSQNAGRNNNGRITVRHQGGGHKQAYRVVDFKRAKDGIPAKVERLEYDPNRTANIALICFADGEPDPKVLPLEEDYDVDPMDSYGLSKVVNEKTARSFQLRSGFDIYALRIGNVIEPHEYKELFPKYFKNPEVRRRNAFCYIDARDLGQIVDLCLKKDGLGYQVFNAGNDHNGAILPTNDLIKKYFPNVPISRELAEHEALFSNRKIREMLGFIEQHNWRKYVN